VIDLNALDDPREWVTKANVPLLDEHALVDPDKGLKVRVDRRFLEDVARNGNRRAVESGNPCPLIVGHTEDGGPEKPVDGYVVGLRVGPDPKKPGKAMLFGTYKVRRSRAHVLHDFPRRSVELWVGRREIDPVALLGGTTPERDLGDVAVLKYSRDGGLRYRYSMHPGDTPMPAKSHHYEADAGSADVPGGDDEVVSKVMESSWAKGIEAKLDKILSLLDAGGDGDADDGFGGEDEVPTELSGADGLGGEDDGMGGVPPGGGGMPPPSGGQPPTGGHDPEARFEHEPPPVRFNAGGGMGYGSGTNGYAPAARYARRDPYEVDPMYPSYPAPRYQPQPRPAARPAAPTPEQRQIAELRVKLARSEASKRIDELEAQGYEFADKAKTVQQLVDVATQVGDKAAAGFLADIKANYRRRESDPSALADVLRYSRDAQGPPPAGPQTMDEVQRIVARMQPGQDFASAAAAMYAAQNGVRK
jgi:hypothetical protein